MTTDLQINFNMSGKNKRGYDKRSFEKCCCYTLVHGKITNDINVLLLLYTHSNCYDLLVNDNMFGRHAPRLYRAVHEQIF